MSKNTDIKTLALVAGAIVIAVVATALVAYYYYHIHGHGHIKSVGIGIYDTAQCVTLVTDIDWGTINMGSYSTATVYVKNTGNSNVTLTFSTSNYIPAGSAQFLTLTWDYVTGSIIKPNQVYTMVLKLAVSPNVTGITDFSFDITVTATG